MRNGSLHVIRELSWPVLVSEWEREQRGSSSAQHSPATLGPGVVCIADPKGRLWSAHSLLYSLLDVALCDNTLCRPPNAPLWGGPPREFPNQTPLPPASLQHSTRR